MTSVARFDGFITISSLLLMDLLDFTDFVDFDDLPDLQDLRLERAGRETDVFLE